MPWNLARKASFTLYTCKILLDYNSSLAWLGTFRDPRGKEIISNIGTTR